MKEFRLLLLLISTLITLGACDETFDDSSSTTTPDVVTTTNASTTDVQTTTINAVTTSKINSTTMLNTSETTASAVSTTVATTIPVIEPEVFEFDYKSIPEYNGSPYYVINNNVPYFNTYTTEAFEIYSDLDSLGRCGVAFANICKEIMPTEPRGEIGSVKPTGWHSVKYDCVDGKYLFNRCHLIGYQLAGENANTKNLITGTRYLNVQGMLPFENMVDDYVEETSNHVLYRVTPVFVDNELVARGVLMEAYSVEDSGDGIEFNVFCYNVEPNIFIDYATGESYLIENTTEATTVIVTEAPTQHTTEPITVVQTEPQTTIAAVITDAPSYCYILNTNTKKFHYPSCSSVKQMSESNKQEYNGSRDSVISQGYDPCQRCNP